MRFAWRQKRVQKKYLEGKLIIGHSAIKYFIFYFAIQNYVASAFLHIEKFSLVSP